MDDFLAQATPLYRACKDCDKRTRHVCIKCGYCYSCHSRIERTHKNVSRDPRVALSVTDQANPYNMVTVQGTVVEQTTKGAEDRIDRMAKKYFGLDKYPGRSPGEKRVILKIRPDKVYDMKLC